MKIGIDASNLRAGGGVTHLRQLLEAASPGDFGIEKVVVWSGERLALRLPERPWLAVCHEPLLDGGLVSRLRFQQQLLPSLLVVTGCRLLISPGGTIPGSVTIPAMVYCRNMLPFAPDQIRLYPFLSWIRLRLHLLRLIQARSFLRASAVVFLTRHAREVVFRSLKREVAQSVIIPHGIDARFSRPPVTQKPMTHYTTARPFRILYVSIVDVYKHQWNVALAVAQLRRSGIPVELIVAGALYSSAAEKLRLAVRACDPENAFIDIRGPIDFDSLHELYGSSDLFVFASSCENMPNILLEAMAGSLPIACSDNQPMPEILGPQGGVYFNPNSIPSISSALLRLIENPGLRSSCAEEASRRAACYSWSRCAAETFSFAATMARGEKKESCCEG